MTAYENYNNGNMKDYIPTDEELAELLNLIQEIG